MLHEFSENNRHFVSQGMHEEYITGKYPDKKTAIVTCMDTRLVRLLPAALGIKNGDVKMIKNAGGCICDKYGSDMRSLLIAIYELGVDKVMVIGHTDCGVKGLTGDEMLERMREHGISAESIAQACAEGADFESWFKGFETEEGGVRETVNILKTHPLMHSGVNVSGWLINSFTGELQLVEEESKCSP